MSLARNACSHLPRRTYLRVQAFSRRPLSILSTSRTHVNLEIASSPHSSPKALQSSGKVSIPYVWLRDSCQCSSCVHPSSLQKLHRTSDVPLDITGQVEHTKEGLKIKWDQGLFGRDGKAKEGQEGQHESVYSEGFLRRYSDEGVLARFHHDDVFLHYPVYWDVHRLTQSPSLFLSYPTLQSDKSALLRAFAQLTTHGLLFLRNVPHERTSDAECELRNVACMFGQLRETFYGEVWDVKNVKKSKNIAYTDLDLGLHMDLLYFQHPPRYQILHSLRNRVRGGTSIFVDAIYAAHRLRTRRPEGFDLLTKVPVGYHYINDGHHLHHEHPVIALQPSHSPSSSSQLQQQIVHINYSPPFQAPLSSSTPPEFYSALARYAELLEDPVGRFEYTLKEGEAVLFDNRRVLHARTAFYEIEGNGAGRGAGTQRKTPTLTTREGETSRWLKGCYLEADAVLDKARMLKAKVLSGST